MEHVAIAADVLVAIDVHARADAPRECCGLLLGRVGGDDGVISIERAVATRNLSPSPARYLIDPADHFRLIRETRQPAGDGLAIVGAYHSHPRPGSQPIPSPTDLAEALPNFLYLIATPRGGAAGSDLRAWMLDAGNFRARALVTVA